MRSHWHALVASVLLVGLLGCDEEDPGPDSGLLLDTGTSDVGDTAAQTDAADGSDGSDGDVAQPPCGIAPLDLGTLHKGQVGDRNLMPWPIDSRAVACRDAPIDHGRLVQFDVAHPGVLTVDVIVTGDRSAAVELRSGGCDEGTVVACEGDGRNQMVVEPGNDYALWIGVEGPEPSTMQIDWEFEDLTCRPSESPVCDGGELTVCEDPDDPPKVYACAGGGCASDQQCGADTCQGAVAIDATTLPRTVPANQPAYNHDWSPAETASCDIGGGPVAGVDTFFRLTGLTSGQQLVFDARGSDTGVAFYVIEGCGATECKTAGVYDSEGDNVVRWTSDIDGEAILVVDALSEPNRQSISFEVLGGM